MDVLTFLWLALTVVGGLVLGIAALLPLRSSAVNNPAAKLPPQRSPLQVRPYILVSFFLLSLLGMIGTIGYVWETMH